MNRTTKDSVKLVMALLLTASYATAQDTAQESGVPGDGIPDFYYFPVDGLSVETSLGTITRPAGDLTMDTDGNDIVAMFIGGPNVTGDCNLCDGSNMPGVDALANASTWTLGYSAGSNQFIRTNPLSGPGFNGVTGTGYVTGGGVVAPWPDDIPPFLDFPEPNLGILRFPPGLDEDDFTKVFDDGTGQVWNVLSATDASGGFFTNVTIVPEPSGALLLLLGIATALRRLH